MKLTNVPMSSVFCILIAWLPLSLFAQDSSSVVENAALKQSDKPIQIIVTPTFKISDIQNLIFELEEDFIGRFNELNIDDDYDVTCYNSMPTNSHIGIRSCEPHFLSDERARNASEAAADVGRAKNSQDLYEVFVFTPRGLRKEVHEEYGIFQAKLVEAAESDESLRAIAVEIDRLNSRLKSFGKDK